jgi:DNA-binding GntR family transcriptional regulator
MSNILVDEIYESIQEEIILNKFLPGQRLHIVQLAEHYNVGREPVREALSHLLSTELIIVIIKKDSESLLFLVLICVIFIEHVYILN